MRKIKKILSIVFVLAIMASVCIIPASADEIQPRAPMCDCGGSYVKTGTNYRSWNFIKDMECSHYVGYKDKRYSRKVYYVYECDDCTNEYESYAYTEYKTVCGKDGSVHYS